MDTHNKVEALLDTRQQNFPVINIEAEFPLDGVMHEHASLNANLIFFWIPGGFVSDRDSTPPIWIDMSKSLSDASDDSFS